MPLLRLRCHRRSKIRHCCCRASLKDPATLLPRSAGTASTRAVCAACALPDSTPLALSANRRALLRHEPAA
ncbi:hypothetical protein Dimus_001288, partial [Dionaea muscipula]